MRCRSPTTARRASASAWRDASTKPECCASRRKRNEVSSPIAIAHSRGWKSCCPTPSPNKRRESQRERRARRSSAASKRKSAARGRRNCGARSTKTTHDSWRYFNCSFARMAKIHHLNCISTCPLGGLLMDARTPSLVRRGHLVCHCLLVETNEGLVLLDTGFGLRDVHAPRTRLSWFFLTLVDPDFREDLTAIRQIA